MALTYFRSKIHATVPRWLRGRVAFAVLDAIAAQFDMLGDMAREAVRRRHPIPGESDDALGPIGRTRRIHRGPNETSTVYADRLRRWLDDHATRGGPYALLDQLGAFYAANPVAMDLVYRSGTRFRRDIAGNVMRDQIYWNPDPIAAWGDGGNWGDGGLWGFDATRWAQWWLFLYVPTGTITSDGNWGDPGSWGDGYVWGAQMLPAEVEQYRTVPGEWNAAHAIGHVTLLEPAAELWGYPSGTWGDPGVWGGGDAIAIDIV